MARSKTTRQARLMAACSHGSHHPKCPPKHVADSFNRRDEGTGILSKAAKEINRTADNRHWAPGLKSGAGKSGGKRAR